MKRKLKNPSYSNTTDTNKHKSHQLFPLTTPWPHGTWPRTSIKKLRAEARSMDLLRPVVKLCSGFQAEPPRSMQSVHPEARGEKTSEAESMVILKGKSEQNSTSCEEAKSHT